MATPHGDPYGNGLHHSPFHSACSARADMLVGVPDGMGAMLKDDSTVRIIFQSESYGPMYYESYPFIVNPDGASFTGSHVMYVDYDRDGLARFMSHGESAEGLVKDAGNLIESVVNLKGNLVEKRSEDGCTAHPHYSNTDPNGCGMWTDIMNTGTPTDADWLMQSLCSAHLEEKHQWGAGLGVEDDLFITNEEWTRYVTGSNYTGIPAHVIDIATKTSYATGVFTLGGFEKIVELNCGHPDYVCFSPSGYNGAFSVDKDAEAARKNAMGKRPDGTDYVFPQNVCPARLWIGKKGYNAKGEAANDFLSRNGLAYGKLYGFATNDAAARSSRDAWHKVASRANGDTVSGAFYPLDWQWDGVRGPAMHVHPCCAIGHNRPSRNQNAPSSSRVAPQVTCTPSCTTGRGPSSTCQTLGTRPSSSGMATAMTNPAQRPSTTPPIPMEARASCRARLRATSASTT